MTDILHTRLPEAQQHPYIVLYESANCGLSGLQEIASHS